MELDFVAGLGNQRNPTRCCVAWSEELVKAGCSYKVACGGRLRVRGRREREGRTNGRRRIPKPPFFPREESRCRARGYTGYADVYTAFSYTARRRVIERTHFLAHATQGDVGGETSRAASSTSTTTSVERRYDRRWWTRSGLLPPAITMGR